MIRNALTILALGGLTTACGGAGPLARSYKTTVTATAPVRAEPVVRKLDVPEKIQFRPGRAGIRSWSYDALDSVVATLKEHPDLQIEIQGHTDSRGTEDKNLRLSQQRANAVRTYLVDRGVDAERLTAVGYGESRPITDNDSRESRFKNRRVDFVVMSGTPVARN